ncbi:MAG: PocR ligand-binding domain-containing protein [Clostridia bacterium]|nr:PocR ligand-binding domain-containing protein [Clostridia bacterium]
MPISFDVKKLDRLLSAYHRCFNITVTLFDHKLNCVTHTGEWADYCMYIREDERRSALCHECDIKHSFESRDIHDTVKYTCHAGICEIVAPVFCDDIIVAYLMIGKFRDAEKDYTSEEMIMDICDKYGLDKTRMLDAYRSLPVFDKSYIDDAVLILQSCISYIVGTEEVIRFNRPIIARLISEYIEEHISDKITAETLCDQFHVARHILYDIFDKNFNTTVQRYIADKRLDTAKTLLISTDKPLRQISDETGFSDYNYFINFFKKETGMPPHQYRKKHREI